MTAQEEFKAFLEQQSESGYELGDITGTPEGDMIEYTTLKIAVAQEQAAKEEQMVLMNEELRALEEQFHIDEAAIRAKYN